MNYNVCIERIEINMNKMILSIKGEIEDEDIGKGIFSKPKLIMLFDNGKEDRRIPFVIKEIGYFGNICRFGGEYTYNLDMIFWKTRGNRLPFNMNFALSYGNYYYDEISVDPAQPEIVVIENRYMIMYSPKEIRFWAAKKSAKRESRVIKGFCSLVRFIFYFAMLLIAIALIPMFLLESILALLGCADLAVKPTGSVIGRIIGHVNRRITQMSTFKFTINRLNRAMILVFYKLFSIKRVKPNRISFISARRTDISGNFAFVYDKIKDNDELDIRFVLNKKTIRQLNIVDIIKFCKACATSKVIVLDEFTPQIHFIDLKPETKLIQLWHACGAFKTFGFTRLGKPKGSPQQTRNHRSYDYVTVSSEYCKRCHSEGFGIPYNNVVPTGIPRTDVFFDEEYAKSVREQFFEKYPQLKGKKILLFAPTFRGDIKELSYYPFDMFDVKTVCDSIPDDYAIIIKHHPFIIKKHPVPKGYEDRVFDMSANTEINDLLFVTDLIITDYSSLVFEASLLKIPMIFYVFDLDEYIRNRDFYFDLRLNSPGRLVFDQQTLIDTINSGDFAEERIESFKNMFFDHTDGKSTERVVDLILNAMKSEEK